MEKIKSYTDIEQSKKLAEILPFESANMYFIGHQSIINPKEWEYEDAPKVRGKYIAFDDKRIFYPCWSLTALLGVLPNYQLQTQDDGIGILCSCNGKFNIVTADNPVDACYKMVIHLHEQNLL